MASEDRLAVYYQRRAAYEHDLAVYQAELIKYRADLDVWNGLSRSEQAEYHAIAERDSRNRWCMFLAVCIAIGLYLYLKKHLHGTWFWVVWSGLSVASGGTIAWQSQRIGLLARALGYAAGGLLLVVIIEAFLFSRNPHFMTDREGNVINIVTPIVGFLIGLVIRASGAPKAPKPPRAPTRPA